MLNFPIPTVDKQALEELIASRRALSTVALAQELDFFLLLLMALSRSIRFRIG